MSARCRAGRGAGIDDEPAVPSDQVEIGAAVGDHHAILRPEVFGRERLARQRFRSGPRPDRGSVGRCGSL
ncbi:hypothetical protein [Frigoriglobus tundricola]|uniref:hypothetical protein n=1 Tax=Frigoriglobus tundricola TaxID=2774151 RepID=UPI00148EA29A|nr:hypothetical protein [Frigoriglobus tundricola]